MIAAAPTIRNGPADHIVSRALIAVGLVVLLLGCGWAIGAEHAKVVLLAFAFLGLSTLALTRRGALVGILLLAGMNGIPFVDTSTLVTSKLAVADLAVIGLLLAGATWVVLDGVPRAPSKVSRVISRIGLFLAAWYLYVMARTLVDHHVPLLRALYFGRDFILFALLLVVLPRLQLTGREINVLLGILVAGVCIFALGQIMTATGFGRPGSLIHYHYTLAESGLTRVYSNMTDLVTATLALGVAAVLLARQRSVRLIALPIVLLLTVSTVVQLTRARWIGLILGVVVVSLWLATSSSTGINATVRRRLSIALGALCLAAIVALVILPSIISGGEIFNRLTSVFTDLESSSGTVAIREEVSRAMTALLGQQWPFGLGFVPPFSHYYLALPGGSIRDPDVGALNAVMTMGVLGAILIYLPVVAVLIDCLHRLRQRLTRFSWLYYGGAIWIVATLSSSVTLITLFSTSGLTLTAVLLTVLAYPHPSDVPQAATAPTSVPELSTGVPIGRQALTT